MMKRLGMFVFFLNSVNCWRERASTDEGSEEECLTTCADDRPSSDTWSRNGHYFPGNLPYAIDFNDSVATTATQGAAKQWFDGYANGSDQQQKARD